eukprot:5799135-Pyramimonas_sp.AAC.1
MRGRKEKGEERGRCGVECRAVSLQNEGPTPQDVWGNEGVGDPTAPFKTNARPTEDWNMCHQW